MGDNIAVDWGAGSNMDPEGPLGVVHEGYKGALMGYDLGQKAAVRHALNGLDINDPKSIDAAMGGLVKAGAMDQGSALQNLAFTRSLRQQIPALMSSLMGQPPLAQASSAAPGAPAPAADAQPGADPSHALETFQMAKGAADKLLSTPLAERPAAFEAVKADMLKRGIPEAAIDAAGQDLSDTGLQGLSQHYGELLAHAQHQVSPQEGAQPPPMPTPHASNNWYQNVVDNPQIPLAVSMMKSAGLDFTPYLEEARALAMPGIQKQAELNYTGPIEATKAGVEVAKRVALVDTEARQAGLVASAQEAAKAPYEFKEFKGPDGQPVYVRNDYASTYAAMHGGVMGQGIAPAEQQFRTDQAGQAAELLKPDPASRNLAADSQASAERALSIIQTIKFDQATPIKAQIANALRTAGFKDADKYANDVAGYQQATTQALVQGAHTAFPSRITDRDIKLMHDIYPTLTTPNAAASVAMGTQAAQALRTQQWEDFKANYSGAHASPGDIQKAWLAGPGGQSILQSPEWSKIPIGGRPAFNPATDIKTVKGVKWGAWGLGTGHPVYFAVH